MKRFIGNISPFLLLVIPFVVILLVMAAQTGSEITQERIQVNASFISLPEASIFKVLLSR